MRRSSELVDADSVVWSDALAQIPHDVYHLPAYATVDAGDDGRPAAYVYREDDSVLLLPLVLKPIEGTDGSLDAVSPYGYPGPVAHVADGVDATEFWSRATAAFAPTLRESGVVCCFVRLNPLLDGPRSALAAAGTLVEHGPTIAVDVVQTPEERWTGTRSNHRRQINKARREGITTVVDDWDRLPEFIAIYHETMKRVGAVDFYFFDDAYFDALRTQLGDHLHLVVAVRDDTVLAGGLLFENDGIVQYHLGATRDDALVMQPMKLVLNDAMDWAHHRGARVLHLGGGVGGTEDPLLHFKLGFSPWQLPYATWRVAIDPDAYAALVAERAPGVDPTDLGAFFPAYRRSA
jgi:hypothetical protein